MPISRLFYSIEGDTSKLDAAFSKAMESIKGFHVTVDNFGKRLIASTQDAINPTIQLTEQLKLLQMAGIKNADIWQAHGDKYKAAADQMRKFGQEIPAHMQEFLSYGKSIDENLTQKLLRFETSLKSVGESMKNAGRQMSIAITAPIVGIGAAVFKAAEDYDDAISQIRRRTGATGETFKAFSEDVKAIWGTLPQSAEKIGVAIAALNAKLGLAGEPLREMATQVLNLSRITGMDLDPLITASTRLFGDWSVKTSDQAKVLDYVFKATQKTGTGIQYLMELVVQFGAPLRALGFNLEQAVVMLGKWQKEGVNVETVLSGLRFALGNFAKAHADPVQALTTIIERIKTAKTESDATAIAFQTFGKRAAVDMGRAILEGRLDIDELIKSVKAAPDTINDAAAATTHFSDRLAMMRQRLEKAMLPIGESLVESIERMQPVIEDLIRAVGRWSEAFAKLNPDMQKIILGSAAAAAALGPLTMAVGLTVQGIGSLIGMISGAGGFIAVLGTLATAATAVAIAFASWNAAAWFDGIIKGADKLKYILENLGLEHTFQNVGSVSKTAEDAILKQARALAEQARQLGIVDERLEKYKDLIAEGKLKLPDIFKQGYDESAAQYRDRMQELIDTFKKAHPAAAAVATAIGEVGNKARMSAGGLGELDKETKKNLEAWKHLVDPLGVVMEKVNEFIALGNSQAQVLRVMYPEIIKAGDAQKALSQPLTETEQKLYDAARAMDHYLNHSKNVRQANSEMLASFDPLAELPMPDFSRPISKIEADAKHIDKILHDTFGKDPTFEAEVDARFNQIKPKMSEVAEIWKRQVSTIVTDFGRGMADIIFSGKSFGESLKNIFIDIGKSIIRTLTEILFVPFEKWLLRILTGAAATGTAAAGTGGGLSGLGGLALGGLGSLAGIAGTAGVAGGLMMPGGVPGKIAGGLGMGVLGGAGAIYGGLIPGMGAATFGSALSYMSSGAFLPGIGAGGLLGLGSLTMPVIGGAAVGLYYGIKALVKAFQGPSTQEAGAEEIMRDLGINVGKDTLKNFIGQYINPEQAWGIRKDLLSSPAFLTQIAGPTAEAQGRMDSFLKSLESIKTSFGTFNFREAFETGKATGDWSELNRQFVDAFEHSNELRKMLPDFATKLLAVSDSTEAVKTETDILTDSLTGLRDTISASITPFKDMYQRFLETGEITEEFSKKITELGGDIRTFRDLADLSAINNEFATMVDHFRQTGEILPRLRELFIQFGGDLKALDAAAALPGLQKQLSFIGDIQSRLQALSPQGTAIEKMFSGQWDETMWGALASQGLDPSKLTNFIDLTKFKGGWEQAVSQFQQSGKMNTLLEQAIWKFGGQPGTVALERLQQGFNTITPGLLTDVYSKMTEEYNKAVTSALDYIGKVQQETSNKITSLQTAVENQFTIVGGSITTAIDNAKRDVVAVLNAILIKLGGTPIIPVSNTQIANLPGPAGNPEKPIIIGNENNRGPTSGITVQVYVENAYGLDDLDNKVASSIARTVSRGGLRYMPA